MSMWIVQEALWARLEMVHSPAAHLLLARMHFHRCTCFQVSLGFCLLGFLTSSMKVKVTSCWR